MPFSTAVIQAITARRRQTAPEPRVDTYRFPPPIAFGPHDVDRALSIVEFVAHRSAEFEAAAAAFEDDESRDLFGLLFAYMALGPHHVRLPTNTPEYWCGYAEALAARRGPSSIRFGDHMLDLFSLDYRGIPIELACRVGHVAFTFLRRQYLFERNGIRIQPEPGDTVIDAGACLGDTALAFAACVGEAGRVLSLDPMPAHHRIFEANLARNPILQPRIELIQAALADTSDQMLSFADMGAASRPCETGSTLARTITLDDLMHDRAPNRVDFIKMDIEGGEEAALLGATATIRRFKPKLAISGYHKIDDLLRLPALIKSIEPAYRLYLAHYTIHQEETVIFAAVDT